MPCVEKLAHKQTDKQTMINTFLLGFPFRRAKVSPYLLSSCDLPGSVAGDLNQAEVFLSKFLTDSGPRSDCVQLLWAGQAGLGPGTAKDLQVQGMRSREARGREGSPVYRPGRRGWERNPSGDQGQRLFETNGSWLGP